MKERTLRWIGFAALMIALLIGAYAIVERNNAAMNPSTPGSTAAGFAH